MRPIRVIPPFVSHLCHPKKSQECCWKDHYSIMCNRNTQGGVRSLEKKRKKENWKREYNNNSAISSSFTACGMAGNVTC